MPFALIIAFAASLSLHVAALFGPDVDMSTEPESMPLVAELRPMPKPLIEPVANLPRRDVAKPKSKLQQKIEARPSATPVLSVPDASPSVATTFNAPPAPAVLVPSATEVVSRMPERGKIRYRVDRGDSNFEIGFAQHEWEMVDGRYRLSSVLETTGMVWLFKAYRMEMESRGQMTSTGLRPDSFSIRRNGQETKEKAAFDWEKMTVRVGDRAEQSLAYGAQDLLSFNYQLGFMPHPEAGTTLPIATGRKYGVYRLEVLGDEEIEVPAGLMRTLHLRAPGVNTTELWLAYDYLLLPVKIRHVDAKGDSFVQMATKIQLSPD